MHKQLQAVRDRYDELGQLLQQPDVVSDQARLRALINNVDDFGFDRIEVFRLFSAAENSEFFGADADGDLRAVRKFVFVERGEFAQAVHRNPPISPFILATVILIDISLIKGYPYIR